MNYNKIKKELRLFFSWKQTKLELKAFLAPSIDILKKCDVSENVINEFTKKWDFNGKLADRLSHKIMIVLLFLIILMFINDFILV